MKPREKLQERGVEALSDIELVSILISYGCKGTDFTKISLNIIELLRRSYDNREIPSIETILKIHGVGSSKAMKILAAIELGYRFNSKLNSFNVKLSTRRSVAEHFASISELDREHFIVALLNARYELIKKEELSSGTLSKVSVSAREVLRFALLNNSYGIIVVHNHPSGDPSPSDQDIQVTDRLRRSCDLMDIRFIDHVIIARGGWCGIDV